ncbi:ImmA/IrrE family metallo-endopeptidase [Vreelandella titanicae]|uniref:ImmA/IrrE family metallo-endopeptidase n=1 Tax=Vreelandella titanicae TaxID=664683 RepID=UPI0039BFB8F2
MAKPMVTAAAKLALENAWDGLLPIDPREIANGILVSGRADDYYPIHVEAIPDLEYSGEAFFDDARQRFVCRFKSSEYPTRNNFTIAHELGHIILGHVNKGERPRRDTRVRMFSNDSKEVDANQFAAELLMPKKEILTAVDRYDSLDKVARIFQVSSTAMSYRLKNLGLLSVEFA